MDLAHRKKLEQLQMLSKATMTGEGVSGHHNSSISVTDSATQVDSTPPRKHTRSIAVSPIKPPVRQTQEKSTQISEAVERKIPDRPLRSHRRTHSEGDSLFYRRKARDALKRVKNISKELRDISLPVGEQGTKSGNPSGAEESAPELKTQSIGCQCKKVDQTMNSSKHMPGAQKCAFQQQIKTLQRQLRAVKQQVGELQRI